MLDILIPAHLPNLPLVAKCVSAIDKHTAGIPHKILISIDGVTRADCGELEAFLDERKAPREPTMVGRPGAHQIYNDLPEPESNHQLLVREEPIYFQQSIAELVQHARQDLVMILPPWVELRDPKWLGKLQQPMQMDPHTMLVAVPAPEAGPQTLPPARYPRRAHPGIEAILTRRAVAEDIVPRMGDVVSVREWVDEYSRVAEERGGTRWLAPSVRYYTFKHEEPFRAPCPTPDSSALQAGKSESPSPTTPASSSPTTTGTGGPGDSLPF